MINSLRLPQYGAVPVLAFHIFAYQTTALGQEKLKIKAERPGVALAISGDNTLLAYSGKGFRERQIVVCDLETGKEVFACGENESMACSLVFSPTKPLLVGVGGSNILNIWNVKDKSHLLALKGVSTAFRAAAFSRDGKTLAILTAQNTVSLLDVEKRK